MGHSVILQGKSTKVDSEHSKILRKVVFQPLYSRQGVHIGLGDGNPQTAALRVDSTIEHLGFTQQQCD